jgi:hypothetical protein
MPADRRARRPGGVLVATRQSSRLAYFGASRVLADVNVSWRFLTFLRVDRYS